MKYLPLLLLLTGCASMMPNVEISISCSELQGKVGNSCSITVPEDADVQVNGETININYAGRK